MNHLNRTMNRRALIVAFVPALLTGFANTATAQPFDISWYTIDCGGGPSAGGSFQLSGTIGQHDAGVMSGGPFTLTGGFWSGAGAALCYADCDANGSLDIFDFLCFQNSFVSGEPYACDCDPDPVCDIFDFLCFQNAFVAGCP
ncbi:MAG: hypothetical protein IID31_05810 [Planctomycetes bacterium]|nr:hypothetical protein [Planctomycetota bacterium]